MSTFHFTQLYSYIDDVDFLQTKSSNIYQNGGILTYTLEYCGLLTLETSTTSTLCIKFQVSNIKFLVVNCVYLNCNFVLLLLLPFVWKYKVWTQFISKYDAPLFQPNMSLYPYTSYTQNTKIYILLLVLHLLNYYYIVLFVDSDVGRNKFKLI